MGDVDDGVGFENGSTKQRKVTTPSISMPPPPSMPPKKQSSQPKALSEAMAMPPPPPVKLTNNDIGASNGNTNPMPSPPPVAKPQQERPIKKEEKDNDKEKEQENNVMPPPPPVAIPQQERLVKEEENHKEKEQEKKASTAPVGGTGFGGINSYVPPKGAARPRHEFALEVIKEGSVIASLPVHEKDHYVFGRHERCDFVIEHPSASRLHAVLQYREAPSGNGETEAFMFDMGSTHGTIVNKQQVKPNVFVPLTVGSIIKFGQSTRLYIFQGPTELMPEEGLSRPERRALRQLEAAEEARIRAESLARAALDSSREREVTWGMGEDAEDDQEAETETEEVTWETYKGELTDKQQTLKDKVYKRQQKLNNLRTEIDRIQAKEAAQSGLTPGQASQVARNDQRIQQVMEELESMEETLNDSIRESLGAKTRNRLGIKSRTKTKKKPGEESEDESASDDDEFYDRASMRGKGKSKKGAAKVESAETIWAQLHALEAKRRETEARLAEELAKEEAINIGHQQQQQPSSTADDALDAFMTDVAHQIEADGVSRVRHQLEELTAEEARLRKLLRIADPDGLYIPKVQAIIPAPSASSQQQVALSPGSKAHTVVRPNMKAEAPAVSTDTVTVKPAVWDGDAPGLRAPENHDIVTAVTTSALASIPPSHAEADEATSATASDNTTMLEAAANVLAPNQAKWLGVGAPKAPTDQRHDHHPQVDLGPHDEKHDGGFVARKALLEVSKKKKKPNDESAKGLSELPPDVSADEAVAEKIALLLRHSHGLTPADSDEDETMMSPSLRKRKADASHASPSHASKKASKSAGGAEKSNETGRRVYGPARPPPASDAIAEQEEDELEAPWLPPEGQTGDGRTKLNDKLGY